MKNLSYYSFKDTGSDGLNLNSRASYEMPLMINCAGTISLSAPFTTYNPLGRQDYYLMYIVEGKLKLGEGISARTVGAAQAVIFPPEYKYIYSFSVDGTVSYYFVSVVLSLGCAYTYIKICLYKSIYYIKHFCFYQSFSCFRIKNKKQFLLFHSHSSF